ncbi:MAG: alpha/beta hydrolase [Chloroflexi bacterium]|nr:alpha/beta hydrolase [Chloroflexota bacterium]
MKEAFIPTQDGAIHCLKGGNGPSLVLLHSVGTSAEAWRHVWESLAQSFSLYAMDMMGHGDSDKPRRDYSIADYADSAVTFMTALNLDKATLIGNSIGAVIALHLAATYAERVEKMILVGCPGWETEAERKERLTLSSGNFDAQRLPLPITMDNISLTYRHPSQELLDWATQCRAKAGRWIWSSLVAVTDYNLVPSLAQVRCPTLLIWGDQDLLSDKAEVLHQGIKGSQVALIEDAGHLPQIDAPQAFVKEMLAFLKEG